MNNKIHNENKTKYWCKLNISKCRHYRRITLKELALQLDISTCHLCAIENGKKELTVIRLIEIANVLQISPHKLLEIEEE